VACFAFVVAWSKRPATRGLFSAVIDDQGAETLIKQVVGFVAIRLVWSIATIVASAIATDAPKAAFLVVAGWAVALPSAALIPLCGYCGAKERHRWTIGVFVAFNALSAMWSTVLVLSMLPLFSMSFSLKAVLLPTLQALSILISVANGAAGYRLWDHTSMRGAIGARLIQTQATLVVHAGTAFEVQTGPTPAQFMPSLMPSTLADFCAANKFTAFEAALEVLGVAEASELEYVTDEQLTAIGFNAIQLKRLRKHFPVATEATSAVSTPQPATPQPNAANASHPPAPAIDQSAVDATVVIPEATNAATGLFANTIGGSE
jgi:hypothetical protein